MKTLRSCRGFTLIEILAAVSVMAIIMVICAQLIGLVSKTLASGKARVDNFSQARVVLGLIDRDVQSMILRSDVAAFVDDTGLSSCAFYTRMNGAVGDRRLSLVQYRLETDASSNPRMMRRDYGMDYGTLTPVRKLQFNTTTSLGDLTQAEGQEIAEGIVRFEWQFVAADGTLPLNFKYDYAHPEAVTNTSAMVLSILVLDSKAYKLAKDSGKMSDLLVAFTGPPAAGQSYGAYWRSLMAAQGFGAGLPRPIVESVRIFDRTVHIPLQTKVP